MHRWNSSFRVKDSHARLRRTRALVAKQKSLRAKRKVMTGSEAQMKQDLTVYFAAFIRNRDPHCIICGQPTTEAAHLWHRDMPRTEFDPENVWGNCHDCNSRNEYAPQPMRDAVFLRLGERGYDDLANRAHDQKFKLGYAELEAKYLEYQGIYKRLRKAA